jgi:hypothetical protein
VITASVWFSVGGAPIVITTPSERTTFSQWRRMWQRGQSRQSTGQQGVDSGGARTDAEERTWLEEIGQNTALTRRGFFVSMLSKQEARS